MKATRWISFESLNALGASLSDSLLSIVSSGHARSESSGYSAALSSSRPGSKRPSSNNSTPTRGVSKRPRHSISSQGTPSSSDGISGNGDGPSNSARSGVSTRSTITTGLTGITASAAAVSGTSAVAGTRTGLTNMLTVKEAKMPEVSCSKWEQSMFFNHLAHILRGVTVSASIPTAVGLNDLPPISEFERNHGCNGCCLFVHQFGVLASRKRCDASQAGDEWSGSCCR